MNLLTEAISFLRAAVLPVVAALLLEELTYGGLVRLLLAPWPGTGRREAPATGLRRWSANAGSPTNKKETENARIEGFAHGRGVLLLAAAVGIPLYGLWIRLRFARRKAAGDPELPQTQLTQTEPAQAQLIQPQGLPGAARPRWHWPLVCLCCWLPASLWCLAEWALSA